MAADEDTEWPNISKCSFFQALTLCQISCFPQKRQDWSVMPPHYILKIGNDVLHNHSKFMLLHVQLRKKNLGGFSSNCTVCAPRTPYMAAQHVPTVGTIGHKKTCF